jgi:hypothetical protein
MMKTLDTISGISGVWPDATAVNDPVQGVGTNVEASWLADLYGFWQALVYGGCGVSAAIAADIAPNGNAESKTVSQLLAAIRAHCGNAGEIVAWGATAIPAGVRLLKCEGQLVHVADYSELIANTYCGDPLNPTAPKFYRCDNAGVRNVAGDHFRLPDLRGYFMRGISPGTTIDPEANRLPGAIQTESIAGHNHDGIRVGAGSSLEYATAAGATFNLPALILSTGSGDIVTTATGTGIGTGTANETRPDNVAVLYCIRY